MDVVLFRVFNHQGHKGFHKVHKGGGFLCSVASLCSLWLFLIKFLFSSWKISLRFSNFNDMEILEIKQTL